ncbi:MAG: dihydroorotate dehydrogenase electron transfer subunit, partial [Eubacteriales bacterium]|nr:dihydroorotate dehydrogenase electron transfer subunit [Eubacteriales bacterium]
MMTLYLEDCTVISHEKINDRDYILTLQTEKIAQEAKAGQFVQLKVADMIDPVLRRPISVHTVDREKGHLKLYYQVLGKGTEILKRTKAGD